MRILLALAVLYFSACTAEKKIVCYYTNWSVYRRGNGKFDVEDIDPKLCTHLIYSFVGISNNDIRVIETDHDLPDKKRGFQRFMKLKLKNPSVKTMVAIGGWNEGSKGFTKLAQNPKSRTEFANNAVQFLKKYKFDGLDLDWEYPAHRDQGGEPQDYKNYVEVVKILKQKLSKHKLLLSAAVAAGEGIASQAYNIPEISKYLDFINVMAYDFHAYWEGKTGHNAPLHAVKDDFSGANVEAAVKYWLSKGAPKDKLILGVPAYGHSFTLSNLRNNGVGAASSGPGAVGPYTGEAGTLAYHEICEMQKNGGLKVSFDEESKVPWGHKGKQWVAFDNVRSIKAKAEFAKQMGLGGAMVWSIDNDDFRGICGEKYPLIKTLNAVLRDGKEVSEEEPSAGTDDSQDSNEEFDDAQNNDPVKPTSTSGDECTSEGNIPDPSSCGFISCVADGQGGFIKYPQACPSTLCYNHQNNACDYQ